MNGNLAYCCRIGQAVANIFGYLDAKYTLEGILKMSQSSWRWLKLEYEDCMTLNPHTGVVVMTAHFVPQNSGQGTLLNKILIQKNLFPIVSVKVNVAWPSAAFQRWNMLNVAKWGYNIPVHLSTKFIPRASTRCTQNGLYIFNNKKIFFKKQTDRGLVRNNRQKDSQTNQKRQTDRLNEITNE